MSHYIVAAGPYAKACARLAASGFQLHWQSAPAGERAKMKRASKTKFTCPECVKTIDEARRSLALRRLSGRT
jgi:hypothetical protein